VEQEQAFYCRDGKVAKSLDDLALILRDMKDDEFSHHVNDYKNDFANWILHVLNDRELAESVSKAGSRQEIILAINERIMRREVSDKLREYTQQPPQIIAVDIPSVQEPLPEQHTFQEQATVQQPITIQPTVQQTMNNTQQTANNQPQTSNEQRPTNHDQPQTTKTAQQPTPEEHIAQQEQKLQSNWGKRMADQKEHPYKYFTLREFIMGVLLGFVLGFVISKLIFSTLLG
jgi:hypothetical protein